MPLTARTASRRSLHPDQECARDAVMRHLRRPHRRATLVSACGTGKTLTSVRIAEALDARRILVVVPTLDLLAQTALAWRSDGRSEHMVLVSSLDAGGHEALAAANVASTNLPSVVAALTAVVGEGHDQIPALTVMCTYDSLDKIEDMRHSRFEVPPFDLAIMDEAHRIAGRADKKWAAVHDAARIRTDRRLYMTATPRSFAAPELAESAAPTRLRSRPVPTLPEAGTVANSMDNEAVYGPTVFEYPLARAVADGVLADYRVLVPTITSSDLRARLNLPTHTNDQNTPAPADALRTTALHLAVLKAMTEHRLRRVLVYFHLVDDARRFTRELGHTLRLLRQMAPELCPETVPRLFFVHGEHTPDERASIFTDFAAADCAIMTNAKLIAEGIDIPSVDAVVFADPTRSVVRCVQALGRALRQPAGQGKMASLVVPVYVPPQADPADILGTAYEPVWAIASALASHDHRILERLPAKANRLSTETSSVITKRWHFDFTVHPERIARAMDLIAFNPRGPASRSRRQGLAAAQVFSDTHGHLDVPPDHTDPAGYELGRFIASMREAHSAGRLEEDWAAEFDALGMIWDKHDAAWRARLTQATDYHASHGHLAAPATTPLGAFLAEQRSLATRGALDPARAADLTAIDPDWQLPHGPDWHRKYHLLRTHLTAGHDLAALHPDTVINSIRIGPWLQRQLSRWDALEPGQQALLTVLGLTPATSPLTAPRRTRRSFAQTVQLLELFLHREGRAPTAREEIEVDGERVRIGPWLAKMRTKQRNGQLPPEHHALMAALFDGDWTDDSTPPASFART
ncbi:DEAD/DEAH box helicase [Streptomyces chrestomyceticus]|uniref:Helicase associated domain protein n=1 Tax=Streptomyces chrestomyceticus TaxID=68185 RepID=A0ABU7WRH6_9ACTN